MGFDFLVGDAIIPAQCCFWLQQLNLIRVKCTIAAVSIKSETFNFDQIKTCGIKFIENTSLMFNHMHLKHEK